jgi:hypothetical protein
MCVCMCFLSQIWSLGVVTWQLLTRQAQPYPNVDNDVTCGQNVTRFNQAEFKVHHLCEHPIFRDLSEACKDETTQKLLALTRQCLQYDAWRRPTARDLLSRFAEEPSPSFAGIAPVSGGGVGTLTRAAVVAAAVAPRNTSPPPESHEGRYND